MLLCERLFCSKLEQKEVESMDRDTPVQDFPGVGAARAKGLAKLGIATAGALLEHYPRQYEDRSVRADIAHAPADRPVCITAMVAGEAKLSRIRKGLELVKVRVVDHSGQMELTFFNQAYVRQALSVGASYCFYGVAEGTGARRRMTNPVFEPEGAGRSTGRIMPVYPLTAGISNNLLAGMVERALASDAAEIEELLPAEIRRDYGLATGRYALHNIHFPEDWQALAAARKRMAFQEFFLFSLGICLLRSRRDGARGHKLEPQPVERFKRLLPFVPTGAQQRAMEEILADVTSGRAMNRLVQGDVGSGKTVVAAWAGWLAVQNGGQAAMMAPTEILARQHYATLSGLLETAGVRVGLLVGSMKAAEKRAVYAALKGGEIDLIVGTHALLSAGVECKNLTMVIADEQHRFGVGQRAALAGKAEGACAPHVLVMSATPIPRTLTLILYGDLEVSILDELPPGRRAVETFLIGEDKRARMLGFVRKQVEEGRQVYIVCPMVEEGEEENSLSLKAATDYAQELKKNIFPDLRVGLIHGRLKAREKESVMEAFGAGALDVLVSTTVIEVGVDVPNASLIIIENAERFGLSQLHQLRGRVGRGAHQSYCVLISSHTDPDTRARLKALCDSTDGFKIAEEDLRLRGPGDIFGARQHGLPLMRMATQVEDLVLLEQARKAAGQLLTEDPGLTRPEHSRLLRKVRELFDEQNNILN